MQILLVARSTRVSSTYNIFQSTGVVVRVATGLNPNGSSPFPQNILRPIWQAKLW